LGVLALVVVNLFLWLSVTLPTVSARQQKQGDASVALKEAAELSSRVIALFNEERFEEALPLAKRALELREEALAADDDLVQASVLNLAEIYKATKKYAEARRLFERLLTTYQRKVGNDDAGMAALLDKVAVVAFLQGDFDQSEKNYQRALTIRETAFGKNSAEVASSLFVLAEFYRFTGKFEKAAPRYEESIRIRSKVLGFRDAEYKKVRERYLCVGYESRAKGVKERVSEFDKKFSEADPEDARNLHEILNGRALSLPKPSYPEEARRGYLEGIVVVKATIDEQGNVIAADDMCGGNPLLVKPSLVAAHKAKFSPTIVDGKPVKVTGDIIYRFVAR
jgi:tetratricopeptide (TPR) repeat protein